MGCRCKNCNDAQAGTIPALIQIRPVVEDPAVAVAFCRDVTAAANPAVADFFQVPLAVAVFQVFDDLPPHTRDFSRELGGHFTCRQ